MMKHKQVTLSYGEQRTRCEQFIRVFQSYNLNQAGQAYEQYGRRKYMIEMQQVANQEKNTIQILMEDLQSFFRKDDEKGMVEGFRTNTSFYVQMFVSIIDPLIPKRNISPNPQDEITNRYLSILKEQRKQNMEINAGSMLARNEEIPIQINQNYDVVIILGEDSKKNMMTISQLGADHIGSLINCKGIIIGASEIKPEMVIATYACDICGCENYLKVKDINFSPMIKCNSKKCLENKVNGKLIFLPGHSKFRSYQELKMQETPDQLKKGSIPRTLMVQLRGNNIKQASPGDIVFLQGLLIPNRMNGFQHQNDLVFTSHIQVYSISREKKKYADMTITEQEIQKIQTVRKNMSDDQLFDKLAKSIAPEIYGMEFVKKALLLMLAGGVTKETHDHLKIRGEINIALIGDPGIAKSQLLKHISYLAPRGIYTSGKGSSGVGLTAVITTNPHTKQLHLEAGALILADTGICCIDEFDKMDEYDRTAIHEVMEQQTVSIAKAGITTTLNARTSILAAANPLYGRYNVKESPFKNINMPAALLSRFQLVFILLDNANNLKDKELANHIGKVHQTSKAPQSLNLFDQPFIRTFIAMAKQFQPVISQKLHKRLINKYVEKRQIEVQDNKEGQSYTTMRTLLSLIRLAQARAKLRFSNEVEQSDILEAMEIFDESQKNVLVGNEERKPREDVMSKIFSLIKDMCNYDINNSTSIKMVEQKATAKGFTLDDVSTCIRQYQLMDLLMQDNGYVIEVLK